jgi:hypothetical protein
MRLSVVHPAEARESTGADVEDLPPRVLSLLAVAGAIATFATSVGDTFPGWVAAVSLGVAVLLALSALFAFLISAYPGHKWLSWVRKEWKAVPLATHRRRLIAGEKVPVSEEDFEIVWQSWCDDVTGVLRGNGFPDKGPPEADADPDAVLRAYHAVNGLRVRALRYADEAWHRGIEGVDRDYRGQFYAVEKAADLWTINIEVYDRFIKPVVTKKAERHARS